MRALESTVSTPSSAVSIRGLSSDTWRMIVEWRRFGALEEAGRGGPRLRMGSSPLRRIATTATFRDVVTSSIAGEQLANATMKLPRRLEVGLIASPLNGVTMPCD